ncbi:hypothetical protein FA15DRAFT_659247 [Coprinopsis marcescibilis]|uniref:F-box domain-containing protein n=1 Tax=Coprinopsis marcescibilis TaxID=230819 RepID=A0A5C3KIY7_COPMA|nr:hypothetical protein FA15DRAFT_659247 [Coprinopsis marcescibilis]
MAILHDVKTARNCSNELVIANQVAPVHRSRHPKPKLYLDVLIHVVKQLVSGIDDSEEYYLEDRLSVITVFSQVCKLWKLAAERTPQAWAQCLDVRLDSPTFTKILSSTGQVLLDVKANVPDSLCFYSTNWDLLFQQQYRFRLLKIQSVSFHNGVDLSILENALSKPASTLEELNLGLLGYISWAMNRNDRFAVLNVASLLSGAAPQLRKLTLADTIFKTANSTFPALHNVTSFAFISSFDFDPLVHTFWLDALRSMPHLERLDIGFVASWGTISAQDDEGSQHCNVSLGKLKDLTIWGTTQSIPIVYRKIKLPHAANVTIASEMHGLSYSSESYIDIERFSDMWDEPMPCDKVILDISCNKLWVKTVQGQRQTIHNYKLHKTAGWAYKGMCWLQDMLNEAPNHGFARAIRTTRTLDLHIACEIEDEDEASDLAEILAEILVYFSRVETLTMSCQTIRLFRRYPLIGYVPNEGQQSSDATAYTLDPILFPSMTKFHINTRAPDIEDLCGQFKRDYAAWRASKQYPAL